MAKRGRKPVLNSIKKAQIVAILAMGCSRRAAAKFVGCDVKTIRNTAARDPEFAEQISQADSRNEYEFLKSIRRAAQHEKYWRAAAWVLERRFPNDYGRRGPEVITVDQIAELLIHFTEIITEEIPVGKMRKRVIKRFNAITARLRDTCKK